MQEIKPDNEHPARFHEAYRKVAPRPDRWPQLIDKVRDSYLSFQGWSESDLRKLAAPLLVMASDRDMVMLEHAIKVFRLVPHGKLAILPGSDHNAPVDRAAWVTEMLLDFFSS